MAATVETKLYVTNFPSSATRQQLQQFFSRFGRVQECAIMWNSYAFVHYATMEEARRALDQSNGAMFLNRKLIVQLSTSRFRPQPKETNTSISQPTLSPQQLMIMNTSSSSSSSSSIPYNGGSKIQQQSTPIIYDRMTSTNIHPQSSLSISDDSNFFRPPSPLSYYIDRMTPSTKLNHIKLNKNIKTDISIHGEIPKLYCTNLPENCKAHDLQRLFSSFGHVTDCVILWDYYAFITYKTFIEAERALIALNGFTWKDRYLIVEWSRASGRRQQQQQTSPIPPRLVSDLSSSSSSSRTRPLTLSTSNGQFYGNNSSHKLQSFNQNLNLISMIQQPYLHHTSMSSYNQEILSNDLSTYIDTNSNTLFSSSDELNTPSSATGSISNVYQPSDIVALLEPSSSSSSSLNDDISCNNKSIGNTINDITNTISTTTINQVPPSCSSAALFQENLLSSLFNTFEPFNKYYPNDEQSSTSRYNHLSPLLTTAPSTNHYPISYGHNISWR